MIRRRSSPVASAGATDVFIPGLHQFVNQGGGRGEAHGESLLAGRQTDAEGDMGLAGAAVSERDDVLTTLDVFASCQLQDQHLVERGDGLEFEAVEAFDGGELGLPDPPLDHAALPVDQLQFGEADKITQMVGHAARAHHRHVRLAQSGQAHALHQDLAKLGSVDRQLHAQAPDRGVESVEVILEAEEGPVPDAHGRRR